MVKKANFHLALREATMRALTSMRLMETSQYLNIKLTDISVTDPDKYPHMLSVKNCFIRGSVVR